MSTIAESITPDLGAGETASGQPRRRGFGHWAATVGWKHLIVWVCIFGAIFPMLYVLSAALNPAGTMVGSNQLFSTISLENFVKLFNTPSQPYAKWFVNTLEVGLTTAFFTVLMCALAAYAFSRMRFTGRRFGLMTLLLVQMFPQMLAFVAIFLLLSSIGQIFPAIGIGSKIGLIMVYLGGALGVNTWLMYGFFNTVPSSLDEAARVDGASHARIFFTIILPLVTPSLAVIGLLSFISTLNEFVIASVVLNDTSNFTLAVGLYQFVSQETNSNWPLFSAGAVLAAIPVLVLFFIAQRWIVSGLTAGSVK